MFRHVLIAAVALVVAGSTVDAKKPVDECFGIKGDERKCNDSFDSVSDCIWCTCSAVPSVCVNYEQAASLPPGVFTCPEIPDQTTFKTALELMN